MCVYVYAISFLHDINNSEYTTWKGFLKNSTGYNNFISGLELPVDLQLLLCIADVFLTVCFDLCFQLRLSQVASS